MTNMTIGTIERNMSYSNNRSSRSRGRFQNNNQYSGNRGSRGQSRSRKVVSFDPSMVASKAAEHVAQPTYTNTHTFETFGLERELVAAALERGYNTPTPIQDQIIPHLLEQRDVIGLASTGTGKTAAFLLPLINAVLLGKSDAVLIMAPTRELAVQIQDEFKLFTRRLNIYSSICIGGTSINKQIGDLRRNPHFVIGTPGRLIDLEQRGVLDFSQFSAIVLDEVDQMFDMGFIQPMKYVIERLPKNRHSLFFSATMPEKMTGIVQSFVKDAVTVQIESQKASVNVNQDVIRINGRSKIDVLHELLIQEQFEKVLVFGRTKHGLDKLANRLFKKGLKVAAIHGNKSQGQRQRALEAFKRNSIQILLATDIASRGLDIDNVSHVINFDLPSTYEDYIHRIGRTGRANKTGTALSFID